MIKEKTIFAIGIWIIILPYLGFPVFWKNLLFVATGLLITVIATLMYKHKQVLARIISTKDARDTIFDDQSTYRTVETPHYIETDRSAYRPATSTRRTKDGPLIHSINETETSDIRPRRRSPRKKIVQETVSVDNGETIETLNRIYVDNDSQSNE
jgi:hypothetical protein